MFNKTLERFKLHIVETTGEKIVEKVTETVQRCIKKQDDNVDLRVLAENIYFALVALLLKNEKTNNYLKSTKKTLDKYKDLANTNSEKYKPIDKSIEKIKEYLQLTSVAFWKEAKYQDDKRKIDLISDLAKLLEKIVILLEKTFSAETDNKKNNNFLQLLEAIIENASDDFLEEARKKLKNHDYDSELKDVVTAKDDKDGNILRKILALGAQPSIDILFNAVIENNITHVKILTSKWLDITNRPLNINSIDSAGYTPLLMALIEQHEQMAIELISRGADPSIYRDVNHKWYQYNALHIAVSNELKVIVIEAILKCKHTNLQKAIDARIDRKAGEYPGYTPLLMALAKKRWDIAIELVNGGADPSISLDRVKPWYNGISVYDWYDYNALHIAVYYDQFKVVETILKCKHANLQKAIDARIDRKGGKCPGCTPVEIAQKYKYQNLVNLFRENEASLSENNINTQIHVDTNQTTQTSHTSTCYSVNVQLGVDESKLDKSFLDASEGRTPQRASSQATLITKQGFIATESDDQQEFQSEIKNV